ncbi:MAG: CAP domain-containing protein [Crocinitomicaceae bacterium]
MPQILWGQEEIVDTAHFDIDLFNKYVLQEVNRIRVRERVDTLIEDHTLDQASQDHADYMAENNVLSHAQKNKEKNSPFDRVKFYGGTHNSVAENIQLVPLNYEFVRSKGKLTYEKLAKEVVANWKKSAEHFKNMVNKDYAGVSHTYAFKNGIMYCCEVFGSKPFREAYEFTEGPEMYVKDKNECGNCRRFQNKINKDQAHLGWYTVSNDSVYYMNATRIGKNKKNIKKLFGAKGAIAVDVIHQEQFDCKGIPSFHNSLYHDGYYIGYISKASLKNDVHPSPDLVKIYVGMKPVFVDTFYQVDFNLIKKWRPCMHGMTIYVNPDFLKPSEYFEIPSPQVIGNEIVIQDSLEVKIAFESGQTNEDKSIFKPLIKELDSLTEKKYIIRSIYFNGVASIEGSKEGNEELFKRRGELIKAYLKEYYPDFELKSEFFENFDDFQTGLVALGIKEAAYMSEDSLRLYANKHKSDKKIMDLLDETRYSSINIVYEDIITLEEGGYALSVKRLQDLIDGKNFHEMVPVYEVLAHHVMDGNIEQQDSLLNIRIPEEPEYAMIHWYSFVLRLNLNDEEVQVDELNHLAEIGAIPNDADLLEYRLMFNIFNRNEAINVSDFGEIFPTIRRKKQKAWIECLELISGVQNYRYSDKMAAPILVDAALKMKFDLKKTYFICQYLIEWGYTTEPYILLSKYAKRSGRMPKLYKQYLKLGYFLGRFEDKKEWKKIRNVFRNLANDHPEEFCDLFRWDQMGVRALEIEEIAQLFCEKCRSDNN